MHFFSFTSTRALAGIAVTQELQTSLATVLGLVEASLTGLRDQRRGVEERLEGLQAGLEVASVLCLLLLKLLLLPPVP